MPSSRPAALPGRHAGGEQLRHRGAASTPASAAGVAAAQRGDDRGVEPRGALVQVAGRGRAAARAAVAHHEQRDVAVVRPARAASAPSGTLSPIAPQFAPSASRTSQAPTVSDSGSSIGPGSSLPERHLQRHAETGEGAARGRRRMPRASGPVPRTISWRAGRRDLGDHLDAGGAQFVQFAGRALGNRRHQHRRMRAERGSDDHCSRLSAQRGVGVHRVQCAVMSSSSAWGRIDDDGTVFVKTADGEREIGSWQAGDAEAGLQFYIRRYEDLATEVDPAREAARVGQRRSGRDQDARRWR